MQRNLATERGDFRRRLLSITTGMVGAGSVAAAAIVALLVDPSPWAWSPYLLATAAMVVVVALQRAGRQGYAVGIVATIATVVTAQSGIREAESVGSALYMLPVALLVIAFVDTARQRRVLLGVLGVAVVLQRALRGVAGVDEVAYGWVEGTFHSFAIYAMFAVLVEVLHARQSRDRLALERVYEAVVELRERAEAEATAALWSSQNKSRFLEAMSHELRTPLNAVVGYSELLLEDESDEVAAADLRRIQEAGKHLVGLVDEVLDVSKVASGRVERDLRPVDIPDLLTQTSDIARPLLRPGVALELDIDDSVSSVRTDALKLRQILVNLLSNAAKFTARGQIVLRARQDIQSLTLEVEDSGAGMDPSTVDELFEAFAQADHRQGSGLGLALCARFAELLGGSIDVTTALGEGSTFTVVLPVSTDGASRSEDSQAARPLSQLVLPSAMRQHESDEWLHVGSITLFVFGVATALLVTLGLLESALGLLPYELLISASLGAWLLSRRGYRYAALTLFVGAAVMVDAHSHVFHQHAQAASLYLCVMALFVSLVLPRRLLPVALAGGGVVAVVMVGLRGWQGLDTPEAFVSIVIDTVLVYTVSAVLLGLQVGRHQHEEEALARTTFDLDRLRVQAREMARAASAESKAKSTFLASMSHELRSPLNAIVGYTELLAEDLGPADPRHEDLGAIRGAAHTLLGLINEVLDLARIQSGRMPMNRQMLELGAAAHHAGLEVRGAGQGLGDAHLLQRAMELLVARGATTCQVIPGEVAWELPFEGELVDDLFAPFAHDPCLGRPGVGFALLQELAITMRGAFLVEPRGQRLRAALRLPLSPDEAIGPESFETF